MTYIGMDISKDSIDLCLLAADGGETHQHISNDAQGWQTLLTSIGAAEKAETVHACCEYTGTYYRGIATALHNAGYRVSVVNAYSIKSYAQLTLSRTKTDRQDARLIAYYCKIHQPPCWQPETAQTLTIKALNRRLEQLSRMRNMENNRRQVADDVCQASHRELIACIDAQIDKTQQQLQTLIAADETSRQRQVLLQSIPGIGEKTAAVLQGVLMNIDRFPTAKHLVSYLGLSPMQRQSGTSVRGRTRISKMGDRYIRKSLYMPARSACLRSRVFRDWAKAQMAQGKHPKVVYVMMMRKLVVYAYHVIKNNQPFNEEMARSA